MLKSTTRRTKVVCTMGPSTDKGDNLERMIAAGANVFRMNFSHGDHAEHMGRAKRVREIAKAQGKYVALLGDLQGPKIRISSFKPELGRKIILDVGQTFVLDCELPRGEGTKEAIGLDYKDLPKYVKSGDVLLLNDGAVWLEVTKVEETKVITKVTVSGIVGDNKGINKLGGGLAADALTEKDKEDIKLAAEIGVDFLAVSFPLKGDDLRYARQLANEAGFNPQIVAKVERAETVETEEAMRDIIEATDVVMVARGDLGVEIGDARLIAAQKALIRLTRSMNKVVITATQMMESMTNAPNPTRAEVMDVSNAVLDGTDAVMLSGETANGSFPVEAVKKMVEVCLGAESMRRIQKSSFRVNRDDFHDAEEATAMSAMFIAQHLPKVRAIVTLTDSGATSRLVSRLSSGLPIFALSGNEKTLRKAALYRGVVPVFYDRDSRTADTAQIALQMLKEQGALVSGDLVVLTHGDELQSGGTNTTRILTVE